MSSNISSEGISLFAQAVLDISKDIIEKRKAETSHECPKCKKMKGFSIKITSTSSSISFGHSSRPSDVDSSSCSLEDSSSCSLEDNTSTSDEDSSSSSDEDSSSSSDEDSFSSSHEDSFSSSNEDSSSSSDEDSSCSSDEDSSSSSDGDSIETSHLPKKEFFEMDPMKTAFLEAVLLTKYDTVKNMLEKGLDVNQVLDNEKNENGIYICAKTRSHKMADLLLKYGCKLSIGCGIMEEPPLHVAVLRGDFDMVKLLLDNGADVTCRDKYETTALHVACKQDLLEMTKLLIERNRTVISMKDHLGETPLHSACKYGSPELIQYLVEQGANVNLSDWGISPLCLLLHSNRRRCTPNIIRFLVDHGAGLSGPISECFHKGNIPLHWLIEKYSSREEYRDVLLYVMERSDLSARNRHGSNILVSILLYGDLDLLKMFLNIGMPEDALSRPMVNCVNYKIWKRVASDRFIKLNIEAIDLLLDIGVPRWSLLSFYPDNEDIRFLRLKMHSDDRPKWALNDMSVLKERVEQRSIEMRTLKSFCRNVVRGCIRMDMVTELGIPQSILKYLLLGDNVQSVK